MCGCVVRDLVVAIDCGLESIVFSASGVPMSGSSAPARTATPSPTRATSVVGPSTNQALVAVSASTSRGVTARSNGSPRVASLISSGVVPNWKTIL